MFIACHLFLGLILGLAIADRLGDRRPIGFSALGAVLPDLLDKPVSHLLLAESLNSGRLFRHGLLFLTLFTFAGIVLERRRGSFALLAACRGFGPDLPGVTRTLVRVSVPLLGLLVAASLYAWAAGIRESILMAGAGPEDYLLLAAVGTIGMIVMIGHREFLNTGRLVSQDG
jgi:hypothetical protein